MPLHVDAIRRQFPLLRQKVDGRPIIYLDSAATSQKPTVVLDAMRKFYEEENGNPHRGMHPLAESATVAYEGARKTVQEFINAERPEEIVFTKNSTESINLVAKTWGKSLKKGDAVVLTILEHHSNIIPWLQLKEERGIELRWIDIDDEGHLRLEQFDEFLRDGKVKLVAVTGQSNVLGVRPPLETIITKSHATGALVLIDAAQLIGHHPIDVQNLDCDFLAFSGHKLYAPAGIGVLYGKRELLRAMPPFLGGGMMIQSVSAQTFLSADPPQKFEAGTQSVADAVGLAAAIEWLSQCSWKDREAHEQLLINHAHALLQKVKGLRLLGPRNPTEISGCISFVVNSVHPHDLTEILGRKGICLRAGHHCAQPLHRRLEVVATTRLSVAIYTTKQEIDSIPGALEETITRVSRT